MQLTLPFFFVYVLLPPFPVLTSLSQTARLGARFFFFFALGDSGSRRRSLSPHGRCSPPGRHPWQRIGPRLSLAAEEAAHPAPDARLLGGGKVMARPHGRRSPPGRHQWQRICPPALHSPPGRRRVPQITLVPSEEGWRVACPHSPRSPAGSHPCGGWAQTLS
jgi:hypothetical protein